MNFYYKAGENYFPGFQKFNIFADPVFRKGIAAFAGLCMIAGPTSFAVSPGLKRELCYVLIYLCYMTPATIIVAGGMPPAAWRWYAAFAVFFACGTIPVVLGAPYTVMVCLIPAVFSVLQMCRIAPGVPAALAYDKPAKPSVDFAFGVILSVVLIAYSWIGQQMIGKGAYRLLSVKEYIWYFCTGALYYGTLWGLFYGLLMRRLLDMRYDLITPMALNIVMNSIYWIPSALGYGLKPEVAIGGSVLQSLTLQSAICMTFYFHRSSWPPFAAYGIYYLFIKSVVV